VRYVTSAPATTTIKTARVYEDFGLLTSGSAIATDVGELLTSSRGLARIGNYEKKLIVSPCPLERVSSS